MRRTTRSQSRQTSNPPPTAPAPLTVAPKYTTNPPPISWTLPPILTPKITSLPRSSVTLLNSKRTKLLTSLPRLRRTTPPPLHPTLSATLVFAQEACGTAVCISPTGLLLTCSHCVADDAPSALEPPSAHWLVFATGRVVRAICVAWDERRDLALLQVTHAQPGSGPNASGAFPHVVVASQPYALPLATPLLCIGHPGSEDLEAETPGQASGYDVLHVSEGVYHGMKRGQDPHVCHLLHLPSPSPLPPFLSLSLLTASSYQFSCVDASADVRAGQLRDRSADARLLDVLGA